MTNFRLENEVKELMQLIPNSIEFSFTYDPAKTYCVNIAESSYSINDIVSSLKKGEAIIFMINQSPAGDSIYWEDHKHDKVVRVYSTMGSIENYLCDMKNKSADLREDEGTMYSKERVSYKSKTVYNGVHAIDEIEVINNGVSYSKERVIRPNAIAALVYNTVTNKFILVEQWRAGALGYTTEIVAGKLDRKDHSKEAAVMREVTEETGYNVDKLCVLVDAYYPAVGYSSEMITIFFCTVSDKITQGGGVDGENEFINIIEKEVADFQNMTLVDGKSIMARLAYNDKTHDWFNENLK